MQELVRGRHGLRGARDLLSVAIQYGNAFGQGFQAAALKAADFFGNDDVLYLMEDMATGEIRLSILWEWLHKGGRFTADDETLPIARAIVKAYVASQTKAPWYIDLLNLNLDEYDLGVARQRIAQFLELFEKDGTRITGNLDFTRHPAV